MGIDKGNTNEDVIYYDSAFGVHYPTISGMDGSGNEVHLLYEVQATPSVIVIQPNRFIAVKQIWPPNTDNLLDSISNVGGIFQSCLTNIELIHAEEILTIRPNPVKDYTNLHLNLLQEKELEIQIFNLTGQRIREFKPKYYPAGNHHIKVDFSINQGGFYFVQVLEKGKVITTQKLILSR